MYRNIVRRILDHAAARPASLAVRFLRDGEQEADELSYGDLAARVRAIGSSLRRHPAPGERVLVILPPGLDLILTFLGCLAAGAVPVLCPPPRPLATHPTRRRLEGVVADGDPRVLVVESPESAQRWPELLAGRLVLTPADGLDGDPAEEPAPAPPDRLAYLQYTSGSTSAPRGVVVRHGMVTDNIAHMDAQARTGEALRQVMWVPPYHDMGLVGGSLYPLGTGASTTLFAPQHFLARPMRWLEAIHRYRGTLSAGPDSAYALCARTVDPGLLPDLDLSSWEATVNGSEPVRAQTMQAFSDRFGPYGFRPQVFNPCYGLAESTLIATGRGAGRGWRTVRLGGDPDSPPGAAHVTVGVPVPGHRIEVVDPESGEPRPDGEIGELILSGPSVSPGYYGGPQAPEPEPRVRTGDLGAWVDGELVVTGRLKDLLILGGRKIHAVDVELTAAEAHEDLQPGGVAAISIPGDDREELVVVAEVRVGARRGHDAERLFARLRQEIFDRHERGPRTLILVGPGQLPRTTSGKLRRFLIREQVREGSLPALARWDRPVDRAGALERELSPLLEPLDWLRKRLAGHRVDPTTALQPETRLADLRLDSLDTLHVAFELASRWRRPLPWPLDLDEVTLGELSAWLLAAPPEPRPRIELHETSDELAGRPAPVPLHPRQRAYLASRRESVGTLGTVVNLRITQTVVRARLEPALDRLSQRFDALRMRFVREGQEWRQQLAASGARVPFETVDMSAWQPGQLAARREALHRSLLAAVDLGGGSPMSALLLDAGRHHNGLLLLYIHHLVADAFSIAHLTSDLTGAVLDHRIVPTTPAPSYRWVCDALAAPVPAALAAAEQSSWDALRAATTVPGPREARLAPVRASQRELTDSQTRDLRRVFPTAADREALLVALLSWVYTGSGRPSPVLIQRHGRTPLDGKDVRSTVGWLALEIPVLVEVADSLPEHVERVRETLAGLHDGGRTRCRVLDVQDNSAADGEIPWLHVEYRGHLDVGVRSGAMPLISSASVGDRAGLRMTRVRCSAAGAFQADRFTWTLTLRSDEDESLARLARAFRECLEECLSSS